MNRVARTVCRSSWIPLAVRRALGRVFVPRSDREYTVAIEGRPYTGRLDNYIEWVAYVTGEYYEYTYLNLIRSFGLGGCALDVGANVGNHATAFAAMFEEVLAFEPFGPAFERLRRKTAHLSHVRAFNVALGDAARTMAFSPPLGSNLGAGRIDEGGAIAVPVVQGDDFLEGKHRLEIQLIKVDVEGYEREVLGGLSRTLERFRPVVIYEAPEAFRGRGRPPLVDSFPLFPEGYEFWGLRGQTSFPIQRRVARAVPLTQRNLGDRFPNVLAAPRERGIPLPG